MNVRFDIRHVLFVCRNLLSASQDGKLIVWDGFTTSKVSAMSFNIAIFQWLVFFFCRFLVSASQDGKLIIWDCYKKNKVSASEWPVHAC